MKAGNRIIVFLRIFIVLVLAELATVLSGCGEVKMGKSSMSLPELGITVEVPKGWKVDGGNFGMCSHGDYIGLLMNEPLDGKTFEKAVGTMSNEFGTKVISRKDMKIGERTAIYIQMDAPNGMRVMRTYIDCGKSIAYLSYAVHKDDYKTYEPALLESLASLKVK